jgi:hypothetical protein
MIVDPPDGKLPALTPQAKALQDAGRSSWRNGQSYETLYDFDTFDRCVSRGMPASMFPFHYNNGVRIFQSPGYVVIVFEMLGQRIIPLGDAPRWPATMQGWLGDSHGHWEGNTLVVETANIRAGNNSAHDYTQRAASVLHMATNGAPPYNSIPVSKAAHATERFTLTGPDTLSYQIRYSDPAVFTAPWTARLDWTRKSDYEFFEYACHEGNNQLRGRITAWKAQQAQERASGAGGGAQ